MTTAEQPVFLIGYRGTGKSTVARELAARLGYEWVDADDVIERETGKTIASIFADEGEGAFRDRESEAVADLSRERRMVIALGGGAVGRLANQDNIRAAGPVVWLRASVDTILDRLSADSTTPSRRPDLSRIGGRAEVEELLAKRTPLYRQCATLIVDTDGKSAAEVADEIANRL